MISSENVYVSSWCHPNFSDPSFGFLATQIPFAQQPCERVPEDHSRQNPFDRIPLNDMCPFLQGSVRGPNLQHAPNASGRAQEHFSRTGTGLAVTRSSMYEEGIEVRLRLGAIAAPVMPDPLAVVSPLSYAGSGITGGPSSPGA